MPRIRTGRPARLFSWCKRLVLAALLVSVLGPALWAADPDIFPLSQVQPGMKGEGYTIFAGDQIEKFDLVVIGVMPNFLAPKESIILAQLVGPKVEHTGVVAGMSGSPIYIDGKLVGALSLKLGQFSKEPLAGITPIENILSLPKGQPGTMRAGSAPFSSGELSSQMDARVAIQQGTSGGNYTHRKYSEPAEGPARHDARRVRAVFVRRAFIADGCASGNSARNLWRELHPSKIF